MTDRKLLALFAGALVLVGGFLWVLVLKDALSTKITSQTSTSTPQPATANPSPKTVSAPAESLKRAKRYLEPPTTRESILAAQSALRSIPTSATEYKEAQRLLASSEIDLKAAEAKAKVEEISRLRDKLKLDYQRILSKANPHLNYITTKLNNHKGGFALWGVHAYFNQYTFSIGDDAKVVSAWIERNRSDLKRAGILRVGVRSSEDWGGWCWFEV